MSVWAAAAQAGSQLLDTGLNIWSGYQANELNRDLAEKQMAFQKESAQNQYKWAMDDMRRSGLNPMLAYQRGGAGTLSGSSIGTAQPLVKGSTSAKDAVAGAIAVKEAQARIDNMEQDTAKKLEETYKTATDGANSRTTGNILESTAVSAQSQATQDRLNEQFFNTPMGQKLRSIDLIGKSLNPFANATNSARSALGK